MFAKRLEPWAQWACWLQQCCSVSQAGNILAGGCIYIFEDMNLRRSALDQHCCTEWIPNEHADYNSAALQPKLETSLREAASHLWGSSIFTGLLWTNIAAQNKSPMSMLTTTVLLCIRSWNNFSFACRVIAMVLSLLFALYSAPRKSTRASTSSLWLTRWARRGSARCVGYRPAHAINLRWYLCIPSNLFRQSWIRWHTVAAAPSAACLHLEGLNGRADLFCRAMVSY